MEAFGKSAAVELAEGRGLFDLWPREGGRICLQGLPSSLSDLFFPPKKSEEMENRPFAK